MCDFEGKFLISNNHLIIFNSNFNHSIFWKTKTCPTINQGINICTIKVRKTKFFFKYSCISLKLVIAEKSNFIVFVFINLIIKYSFFPSAVNRLPLTDFSKYPQNSKHLQMNYTSELVQHESHQALANPQLRHLL